MNNIWLRRARRAAIVVLVWAASPALAVLTLNTGVNPVLAKPGELVDIEITVSNTDAFDRTGVTVSVPYPAGLNAIAPSNFGGSCPPTFCDPGETISWNLGTLRAGRSISVDLPTVIAAATADGTLLNFNFTVTDSSLQSDTSSTVVQVETAPLYDVALRESADPVVPGAQLMYRLMFGYREEALLPADGVLRFPLPAGTGFVFASDGGTLIGDTVEWTLGQMLPGEGGVRTVVVNVNAVDGEVLEASAEIANVADATQRAQTEALTVVDVGAPLGLQIDAHADPARPGELLDVRLQVTNSDPFPRTNLTLRLRYPDGINAISNGNITGGACPPNFCEPIEQVVFTIASIPAESALSFDIAPTIAAAAPDGTLVNFFAMLSDAGGGNATAIDSVRVRTSPRYDLALRESVDPVATGETLTYKVTFGYREEAATVAASAMRFVIPVGTFFDSATGGGVFVGNAVEWDLGTLNPGDGGFREVSVVVNAGTVAPLRAAAGIFDTARPFENAAAEALAWVHGSAALELQIDANADPARPGEMLNVQYVVTNHDTIPRTVTLRGRYPNDVNAIHNGNINWSPAGACPPNFCEAGEQVTFSLGAVAAGQSVTVEISPVVATAAADGTLINFYATATDSLGGVANGSDTVRVHAGTRYDLMLRESADAVMPTEPLTYKLTFGYRADAPSVANSTLRFRVPAGTSFLSATSGGVLSGDFVTWNVGTMSPGDGGVRAVTLQVNAQDSAVLQAQGEIFTTTNLLRHSAAEALTPVDAMPALLLDARVLNNPVQPNQPVSVQFTVSNLDNVARTVTLRARYPDGLFSISPALFTPTGGCPPSFCDPGEIVIWNLGSVAAGGSSVVTMTPTASTTTVLGQLVNVFAIATDTAGGIAVSVDSARAGSCADNDADCDSIPDSVDNCTLVDNADQRDTDGDDIGNACDADIAVPNNCIVNAVDLGRFKLAFFSTPMAINWNADADFDGNNIVNAIDLGVIKQQFFRAPGPSANGCN